MKNQLTTEVGTSILLKRARKGASIILFKKEVKQNANI